MNICIVGWYNRSNVGDEAFRYAHKYIFQGHEIHFVTPPMRGKNPDIAILGGGAVASPFYLNTLPDCPRYALGIDLAYESEADLLAKANFQAVFVRNKSDLPALRSKLQCPVDAFPDLAFMMRPTGRDILSRYKRYPKKKTVGVLVTDYVNPAIDRPVADFGNKAFNFKFNLAQKLDQLSKSGWEVMLIPCSTGGYGDDRRINLDLAAFMEKRPTNVMKTLSPQDTIDLIAQLDLTVCQRFHAHIFSIIAGTAFISIEYTRKVRMLLEENAISDLTGCKFEGVEFNVSNFDDAIQKALTGNYEETFLNIAHQNYTDLQLATKRVREEWIV